MVKSQKFSGRLADFSPPKRFRHVWGGLPPLFGGLSPISPPPVEPPLVPSQIFGNGPKVYMATPIDIVVFKRRKICLTRNR